MPRLTAAPDFNNLIIFKVDFDAQKAAVRSFRAQMQSTLIAFKGTKETARSVGDTDEESIERLLRSTEG
jgi:thioredoxin 1